MGPVAVGVMLVMSAVATYQQSKQQKAAVEDQKDAQRVAGNQQKAQDMLNKRKMLREERIRRGQILQQAENAGVSGASGETGALSSLQATIGANMSNMTMGAQAADAITKYQQSAQDHISTGNTWGQASKVFASGASMAGGYKSFGAFTSQFKTPTVTPVQPGPYGGQQ